MEPWSRLLIPSTLYRILEIFHWEAHTFLGEEYWQGGRHMAGGTLKTLTYLSFLLVVQTGLGSSASGATEDAQQLLASRIPQSIVSIHASRLDPNYLRPWSTHYLRHAYGSGVILQDGNIIILKKKNFKKN